MSMTVTLVSAPGATPKAAWERMRRRAPGASPLECRVVMDAEAGSRDLSGQRMDPALRGFIAASTGADTSDLVLSTAGFELAALEPGSALIHSGMVVLLSPRRLSLTPVRPTPLSLCLESGPDAGRLIPLRRRSYVIGRGRVDVPIADPQLSRREAILTVGSHDVRLKRSEHARGTAVTTSEIFEVGVSECRLVIGAPESSTPQRWPPPQAPVEGRPPEGRHMMMLAFALVPLVAGVVLVVVTGLWFFLLFSGASAAVASTIVIHGHRQRNRYRRARAKAAEAWAEQTSQALASPGLAAQLLRGDGGVTISAAAEDHPAVRVGVGRIEAKLEAEAAGKDAQPELVNTAVGLNLAPGEATVLSGPRRECLRLQRWLVLQLVLNPLRCDIAVHTAGTGLEEVAELRDIPSCHVVTNERASALKAPASGCGVLLSDQLEGGAAEHARRVGWHVVTGDAAAPALSGAAGWKIDFSERTVARRTGTAGSVQHAVELRMDGLSNGTLRELGRLAVPHAKDTAGPGQLPGRASRQLPGELFSGEAATQLLADLGPSLSGFERLDLVGDGPHALLAGTTGSGKSEVLKTMMLSLCARYSPEELAMVLVDFKGGATFQRMARLEHVLGVVTDLSQAAAERTLESIRSELVRRERLFLDADAGDYIEYRSVSTNPLPRMLVVIDEFRIFAHELPDQLDELMRLATLGRSLGLHLVLSTQRPQGVVTADIRANIGACIALRMRAEDESRDVIGDVAAASIPRTLPGRALLRRPGEKPVEFQTALLQSSAPPLRAVPEISASTVIYPEPSSDVVETLVQKLGQLGLERPHTPLLPPLPQTLHPQQTLQAGQGALLGRIDDPASQSQYDLFLDPLQPQSFALIGEASAAAGPACAAVAAQLLRVAESSALYLLDGDRSLQQWDDHPRVGAWLTEEHFAEASYLLDQLCAELTNRRMRRTESHLPLVIVLTGYSRWLAQSQTGFELEHQLGMLAAEGPQVGISVLLAGGRELSVGKLAGRFPQRIFLPYGSGEDVTYLWPKLRSTDALAGRGVLIGSTVASPGLTIQLVTQDCAMPAPAAPISVPDAKRPPIRVRCLPERLRVKELPQVKASGVVVGVQQLSWAPVVMQLGPVNLILGSPGTGKSSCLGLLQHQLPHATLLRPGSDPVTSAPEVLLIDDAHHHSPQQHRVIQDAIAAGVPVVATAPASGAVFHQLPWAHPARTQGSNVILSPQSRTEAEAFAVMIPTLALPIPGRAVHLRPEGPVVAQWATLPKD